MMTALEKWLRYYHPLLRGRFHFGSPALAREREVWHQGLGMTGGRFWVRIRGGHDLRRRAIDPVTGVDVAGASVSALVGRSDGPRADVTTFPWVGHAAGSAYRYSLGVIGAGGVSDHDDAPTAIVAFDATGAWVGPIPNPVGGLAVAQAAGGTFSLTWTYDEAGQAAAPALFEIYNDTGSPGSVDFGSAVATISYRWRQGHFQWTSGPFAHDTHVYWAVRAVSSSGAAGVASAVAFGMAAAALPPAPDDIRVSQGRER